MNIKIGTTIKNLRQEKKVTQGVLASAIGVTTQAISRWESENGNPDIELLPAIADFFAVSIDELLNHRQSEREEELARIYAEVARLDEVGTVEERIRFARESLIRFPGDDKIKEKLAVCLYFLWSENHEEEAARSEAEALLQSVIENCTDLDLKYDAVFTLITIYKESGDPAKASQTAEMLMPMKYCRESVLADGIGDSKTEWYIQDAIDKYADNLGISLRNLALHEDLPNDPSTWDKKIEILKKSNEIYRLIYGDSPMYYHIRLSQNDWLISTYLIAQGKRGEALDALELMCEHTLAYDRSCTEDHGKSFSSILTDKLIYAEPGREPHELTVHNQCFYIP